jgi:hypothetical protein
MSDLIGVVTPVGELHYVQISGQGKLNYNEDGYVYVATVNLTGDAAEELKSKIDAVIGDVPKGKNLKSKGYRELMKDADGLYTPTANTKERDADAEPSGITAFTFSTSTSFSDGKPKKISVYNSANPPSRINLGDKKIGNGSKGAISGKMQRYEKGKDVGISLFLNAVQLVDFKEYVDDAGFEAQDGGFTGEGESFNPSTAESEVSTESKAEATAKPKSKPKL